MLSTSVALMYKTISEQAIYHRKCGFTDSVDLAFSYKQRANQLMCCNLTSDSKYQSPQESQLFDKKYPKFSLHQLLDMLRFVSQRSPTLPLLTRGQ